MPEPDLTILWILNHLIPYLHQELNTPWYYLSLWTFFFFCFIGLTWIIAVIMMATAPPVSDTLSVATSLCVKWSHVGSVASNVVSWFPPQLFRFSCTQPAQWILTTGTEQTRLKSFSLSSSPPLPPRSMEIRERWPLYPAARLFIHVTIVIPSPVVYNTNTACLSPSERVPGLQHLKCKCQHCQAINFSATINWALTICLDYPMLWGKKK